MNELNKNGSWQYNAIETLLKVKEIPLPKGSRFNDKDGNDRNHIRILCWDSTATSQWENSIVLFLDCLLLISSFDKLDV